MSRSRPVVFSVFLATLLVLSILPSGLAAPSPDSAPGPDETGSTSPPIAPKPAPLAQSDIGVQACTDCHFPGAGTERPLNTTTCYDCHPDSAAFADPLPQDRIHSRHQHTDVDLTNLSMPEGHPDLGSKSMFRCSQCHKPRGLTCTRCHDAYHGPDRTDCTACHDTPPDLFAHSIDSIGGGHERFECTVCHDSATSLLQRVNGKQLPLARSYDLCWQCHSTVLEEWTDGDHHVAAFEANETIVHGNVVNQDEIDRQRRTWMAEHSCIKCHEPHHPSVNETVATIPEGPEPERGFSVPSPTEFIPGLDVIALVLAILAFAIGIGFELQRGLLAELGISFGDIFRRIYDGLTHPLAVVRNMPGRAKLVVVLVVVSLVFFKAAFGVFVPFVVVESNSMQPNINKGDVVVYVDYDEPEPIHTHNASRNATGVPYTSFGAYGDVVIFETRRKSTPVVHRAMRRVEKGDPMWEGGKPAPSPGYVTKGDNNDRYDPDTPLLRKPLQPRQIRGVGLYRIPAIGWVRLLLPF